MSKFIKFYFTSSLLNRFRTLIHPSSGACDFFYRITTLVVCSCFDVCWSFNVAGWGGIRAAGWSLPHGYHPNQPHRNSNIHRNKNTQPMWYPCGRLKAEACHTDTTPTQPSETPTHIETRTHNQCGDTIKKSRRLLMMGVLMSETCWA